MMKSGMQVLIADEAPELLTFPGMKNQVGLDHPIVKPAQLLKRLSVLVVVNKNADLDCS